MGRSVNSFVRVWSRSYENWNTIESAREQFLIKLSPLGHRTADKFTVGRYNTLSAVRKNENGRSSPHRRRRRRSFGEFFIKTYRARDRLHVRNVAYNVRRRCIVALLGQLDFVVPIIVLAVHRAKGRRKLNRHLRIPGGAYYLSNVPSGPAPIYAFVSTNYLDAIVSLTNRGVCRVTPENGRAFQNAHVPGGLDDRTSGGHRLGETCAGRNDGRHDANARGKNHPPPFERSVFTTLSNTLRRLCLPVFVLAINADRGRVR